MVFGAQVSPGFVVTISGQSTPTNIQDRLNSEADTETPVTTFVAGFTVPPGFISNQSLAEAFQRRASKKSSVILLPPAITSS